MFANNSKINISGVLQKTFREFAENTSIHGLKYTVKKGVILSERFFWAIVVLLGSLGAGYMTILFWQRYTNTPTRTSILNPFAPLTTLHYPAITLCNTNRIFATKIDDFVHKLDMDSDKTEIVTRALPQLLAFTHPSLITYNMTELNILHKVLLDNDYFDLLVVMRKLSQTCKEMLVKCQWEYADFNCNLLFEDSLTPDGVCCSFNYFINKKKMAAQHTLYNGPDGGLVLLLDNTVQSVRYSSLQAAGIKVLLQFFIYISLRFPQILFHHPYDYPAAGTITKLASIGTIKFLQIFGTIIKCSQQLHALPVDHRKLISSNERQLMYFNKYSDNNCITLCQTMNFYKMCGCVPFFLPFSDKPMCNITKIPCIHEVYKAPFQLDVCDCPSQCDDEIYNIGSTTTLFKQTNYQTMSFLETANISVGKTLVFIHFLKESHQILLRDTVTSTIYLLSSFGGVFSLFLGCSLITIIEIIYYIFLRFAINIKMLGQIDKFQEKRIEIREKLSKNRQNIFVN